MSCNDKSTPPHAAWPRAEALATNGDVISMLSDFDAVASEIRSLDAAERRGGGGSSATAPAARPRSVGAVREALALAAHVIAAEPSQLSFQVGPIGSIDDRFDR